ncbi:MAG: glutamate 5-kinase [Gammaproteobacteria bacterium]|nr:MAG: glutamate 5-kinase [Gammaproteobacteria bacterium]
MSATESARASVARMRRIVVKIGSALLTADGRGLNREGIASWVGQMAALRQQGIEIVIVSSGAVAEGMARLGWKTRPATVHELQAAAAVGQMGLVQAWETAFQQHGCHTAQVLLVHEDVSDRQRYLNARTTLNTLVGLGVVPIVNENDTVATDEIRFGDNDTLAALVANLLDADLLVILTDQAGLCDSDPRENPAAKLLHEVMAGDPELEKMASPRGGVLGRGGMVTKVRAARLAARSGAQTVIANGREQGILGRVMAGDVVGTWFATARKPMAARKQWLAGQVQVSGRLVLDAGAVKVLTESGRSLLPVGVKAVEGEFERGALVLCVDEQGAEIARGLINYKASEARKIQGLKSDQLESVLGMPGERELIHRDNLVLL